MALSSSISSHAVQPGKNDAWYVKFSEDAAHCYNRLIKFDQENAGCLKAAGLAASILVGSSFIYGAYSRIAFSAIALSTGFFRSELEGSLIHLKNKANNFFPLSDDKGEGKRSNQRHTSNSGNISQSDVALRIGAIGGLGLTLLYTLYSLGVGTIGIGSGMFAIGVCARDYAIKQGSSSVDSGVDRSLEPRRVPSESLKQVDSTTSLLTNTTTDQQTPSASAYSRRNNATPPESPLSSAQAQKEIQESRRRYIGASSSVSSSSSLSPFPSSFLT